MIKAIIKLMILTVLVIPMGYDWDILKQKNNIVNPMFQSVK